MNNSDFHILNLSAYQTPEVVENPNEEWIAFGDDNNFYKELIDAFLNSATTGSIIQGISNQIYGKGLNAHNASTKPEAYAQMKSLFKKKCLQKIALDLKLLGEAAFQITYKKKKIESVQHFNRETLRAEKCDDKGKINAYYYHPKWEDFKDFEELTRIPVFGSKAPNEIYIIKKAIPSMHYYSPPDWSSALNYARLECEISEYLVNEVQNSFSGTKLVSFTNGVPTQEKQHLIKNEIMNKLTGANGEKTIISFSDSPETKTTIEDISVSDAADVYSYIAEECSRKLLLANRITSPLLVGIRDTGNSLGSNAEEIENAHNLFENVVIKPYQELILDAIDDILAVNGIALDLFFETLTPIEFVDTEEIVSKEQQEEEIGDIIEETQPTTEEKVEEETESEEDLIDKQASYNGAQIASALSILQNVKEGIITEDQAIVFLVQMLQFDIEVARSMFQGKGSEELLSKIDDTPELKEELETELLKYLETVGESEWDLLLNHELVSVEDASDEPEEFNAEEYLNSLKLSKPQLDSKLDSKIFKVRYKYVRINQAPANKKGNKGRKFCKTLIAKNKIYRKEDIDMLSFRGENKSFGHNGKAYSIWKYKGGKWCKHAWERRVYMKRLNAKGEAWGGAALVGTEKISVAEAIRKGFRLPKQDSLVGKAPYFMPKGGAYN
jgi:hypothetical protein